MAGSVDFKQMGTRWLLLTYGGDYNPGFGLRIMHWVFAGKPIEHETFGDRYGEYPKLRLFGWTFTVRKIPLNG